MIVVGLAGAFVGLMVAVLANIVVLPRVLRQQESALAKTNRTTVVGLDGHNRIQLTRFGYRIVMPVIFAVVGAVAAVNILGDSK